MIDTPEKPHKVRWTPERRAEAAERMRKRHEDPTFAAATAERMRKRNVDPEFAAANAERMRKRNADPEFAAANAERMRKRNADPTFKEKLRQQRPVPNEKRREKTGTASKSDRNKCIASDIIAGQTYQAIARRHGITMQRVAQIAKVAGVSKRSLATGIKTLPSDVTRTVAYPDAPIAIPDP